MFQFRAFPSYGYLIHRTIPEYCSGVLPHSEISGSTLICSSPKLIAACRVLHRLLMPRHSPCALISFTSVMISHNRFSELCRSQQKFSLQNCIYPLIKKFHNCCLKCDPFGPRPLLPCFQLILCSVFKVQLRDVPSKLNNARNSAFLRLCPRKGLTWRLHETCGLVRSP